VELPSNLARYGVNGIYYDSLSGLCWFGYGTVAASEHTSYLAKSRMKVASKFLTHGDMPEPPELLNDLPTVTTPPWYANSGETEPRTFPALLSSAWKAPDGTLGLVFCNISDDEHEVKYELHRKSKTQKRGYRNSSCS